MEYMGMVIVMMVVLWLPIMFINIRIFLLVGGLIACGAVLLVTPYIDGSTVDACREWIDVRLHHRHWPRYRLTIGVDDATYAAVYYDAADATLDRLNGMLRAHGVTRPFARAGAFGQLTAIVHLHDDLRAMALCDDVRRMGYVSVSVKPHDGWSTAAGLGCISGDPMFRAT